MLPVENGPDTAETECAEVTPFVYTELGKSLSSAVVTNAFTLLFSVSGPKASPLQPPRAC